MQFQWCAIDLYDMIWDLYDMVCDFEIEGLMIWYALLM